MELQKKLQHVRKQKRGFIEGSIELFGDEWVFFDDFEDIAHDISTLGPYVEIYKKGKWHKARITETGKVLFNNKLTSFSDGERVRFPKQLLPLYEQLLVALDINTFVGFIESLNEQGYSLYDCIYCYNFQAFLHCEEGAAGVNTLIFDNSEMICTVLHHFERKLNVNNDRFEFTKSSGERLLLSKLMN